MGDRITLTRLEYDVLWEHLDLGPFPPLIAVPSVGVTHTERAELRGRAWASLTARGLGPAADVDDRLAHWLARLARPEWEFDARLLAHHEPRTAVLVARVGRGATVAVLRDDALRLRTVRADRAVAETVRLLPAHPVGTGGSVTLPASALDRAASRAGVDRERFRHALARQGLGKAEAAKVTSVLGAVVRVGHLGVAHTPAGGVRRRGSHVVSVYDNPSGRYLFSRKNGWATLLPGSPTAIARQLEELVAALGSP